MAKWKKKKIEETEGSGFGQYQEGIGGGASPNGTSDPSEHGHGRNSDHRRDNNDTMQPRTDDGKFTYKSVNGEETKYESRGETVNPLLTGGKNGIKISDVESQFSTQSGTYWNKYKDKWYQKGSEYVLMSQGKGHKADWSVRVAGETIWDVAKKKYDKVKGEFTGESKVFKEGKKGARSSEEESARQLAQSTGKEQAVIEQSTGGIKVKPGTVQNFPQNPPKAQKPSQGASIPPSVGVPSSSQLSHTKEQLDAARDVLQQNGIDTSGYTDEQLDQVVDQYIDFGDIDTNNNDEIEEESNAAKKVKELGFAE